jgi:S-adenosylmethionine-dependent methyltransferase
MPPSSIVFDQSVERWIAEQRMPWSQIKYAVTQANLGRHIGAGPLRILDAGGGNGVESLALAAAGHHVTLVDYSAAMLAEARRAAAAAGAEARLDIHQSDVGRLTELFPEPRFDLALCHNVLQYVDDVPALLHSLAATLLPGGLLSLISINRYASPYMATFWRGNPGEALQLLDQRSERAVLFDTDVARYTAAEISAMLLATGFADARDYGLLCVCAYWTDNARKSDPEIYEQLEQLERALTERDPYRQLARYFQIIARTRAAPAHLSDC